MDERISSKYMYGFTQRINENVILIKAQLSKINHECLQVKMHYLLKMFTLENDEINSTK